LPELQQLEFLEKPGVRPVSEDLERALQILGGATWNPRLLVRVFDSDDKKRMKLVAMNRLQHREEVLQRAGRDLLEMLHSV